MLPGFILVHLSEDSRCMGQRFNHARRKEAAIYDPYRTRKAAFGSGKNAHGDRGIFWHRKAAGAGTKIVRDEFVGDSRGSRSHIMKTVVTHCFGLSQGFSTE